MSCCLQHCTKCINSFYAVTGRKRGHSCFGEILCYNLKIFKYFIILNISDVSQMANVSKSATGGRKECSHGAASVSSVINIRWVAKAPGPQYKNQSKRSDQYVRLPQASYEKSCFIIHSVLRFAGLPVRTDAKLLAGWKASTPSQPDLCERRLPGCANGQPAEHWGHRTDPFLFQPLGPKTVSFFAVSEFSCLKPE